MVFTALTLTASAQSYWLVERLFEIGFVSYLFTLTTSVMPFVLLCATFTFLYKFIPYTKVRLSSALIGGAAARILWQLVGMAFAAFVANSARYAAVYSSFAIMIVFLIWLYTGWLIFLVGAEVTYFHQYPSAFVREALTGGRGYRFQEWLALSALVEITRRHFFDEPPWEQTELAARFGVSNLENLIAVIKDGLETVKKILAENYVRPDEAEKVKSTIRERGSLKIIDKVTVTLNEKRDVYEALLANLGVKGVEVGSSYVKKFEKLLVGGIWCII